ncbi:hypothetical protein FQN54_001423 [Arachnomyces sp. PD_36]|nr:hypothetical protein FQN54_001423 [Arachnomyces sp. PD_36]
MTDNEPPHPQPQSPLFSLLPPELRLQIYTHVFSGTIHIVTLHPIPKPTPHTRRRSSNLAHILCSNSPSSSSPEEQEELPCWTRQRSKVHGIRYFNSTGSPHDPIPASNILSLLLTCRRIYTESHPTLYSTPTFDFNSERSLLTFLSNPPNNTPLTPSLPIPPLTSLSLTLSHPRTPRLRSELFALRYPTWSRIWSLLLLPPPTTNFQTTPNNNNIPSHTLTLSHIHITLSIAYQKSRSQKSLFKNPAQELSFFEPLRGVRGLRSLRSFELDASWDVGEEVIGEILPVGITRVGRVRDEDEEGEGI